jgi:hypothetical protein
MHCGIEFCDSMYDKKTGILCGNSPCTGIDFPLENYSVIKDGISKREVKSEG